MFIQLIYLIQSKLAWKVKLNEENRNIEFHLSANSWLQVLEGIKIK